METNFLELKPKEQAKETSMMIYPSDHEKFKKFLDFLNSKNKEGEIATEDIFKQILNVVDDVKGFQEFLSQKTKRGPKARKLV